MATPSRVTFQLFRYQILPISTEFQEDWLEPGVRDMKELLQHKGAFFAQALDSIPEFRFQSTEVTHKLLFSDTENRLYRIGARRTIERELKDFTHENLENWPSLVVLVDLREQTILVEHNFPAFQQPDTVANIIENNVNRALARHHLQCYVEPLFEQADFWEMARRYEGRIVRADFELISPNMPGISNHLTIDLKTIHTHTNSAKTNIEFQSPENSALSLNERDPFIVGLVKYSSEGGGNITLKAKGLKKTLSTRDTKKEIFVDEIEIIGRTGAEIMQAIKGLFR